MGIIRTRTRGANSSFDGACSCAPALTINATNTARHAAPSFLVVILSTPPFRSLFLYGVDSHLGALPTARRDSQEEAVKAFSLPTKVSGRASAQSSGNFGEEPVMIGVVHLKNVNETLSSGHINTLMLGVIVKIVSILGAW